MKTVYSNEKVNITVQASGRLAIYENGNYYYQSDYDKTIQDVEEHNLHKFNLDDNEREFINYIMCNLRRNELIEDINGYYNWNNEDQITIKKDEFNENELEVLLYNDFKDYYCYEDETDDKYIIIEKKGDDENETS